MENTPDGDAAADAVPRSGGPPPVALVTGASRRIGAAIARRLHRDGMNLIVHYRASEREAVALREELETRRARSVELCQLDLLETARLGELVEAARRRWNRLDLLVNNASSYFPTPVGRVDEADWHSLLGSNLKAPFFLIQAALPLLRASRGAIINITDIHAERPRDGHPVYSIAKAGLAMLTRSLAWELRQTVRVNAVAPGAILWASSEDDTGERRRIVERIPLGRSGSPEDIAGAVAYLARDGAYITGHTLVVDGGRSVFG